MSEKNKKPETAGAASPSLVKVVVRKGCTYGARELLKREGETLEVSPNDLRQASDVLMTWDEKIAIEKKSKEPSQGKQSLAFNTLREAFIKSASHAIEAAILAQKTKAELADKTMKTIQALRSQETKKEE